MTEQTTELTVFGRVLEELMESRGIANLSALAKPADEKGPHVDPRKLEQRMRSTANPVGYLDGLAETLELSEDARVRLAMAYTFDLERGK